MNIWMTEGCTGCIASAIGGAAIPQMAECQKRVDAEMKNDPEQLKRLDDAKLRQKMFVDKFAVEPRAPTRDDNMKEDNVPGSGSGEGEKRKVGSNPADPRFGVGAEVTSNRAHREGGAANEDM